MTPTDSQAARLLREVLEECEGVGCEPCFGSYSPFEDLCGRIKAHLDNTRPREDAGVMDEAMVDAALFCTPVDEYGFKMRRPIDVMGLGSIQQLPQARLIMKAALAAALGSSR